jgi:uncharacterized protein (TIGR02246 family)
VLFTLHIAPSEGYALAASDQAANDAAYTACGFYICVFLGQEYTHKHCAFWTINAKWCTLILLTRDEKMNENLAQQAESTLQDAHSIAQANFDTWNNTLLTKNPEAIKALYTEDAYFLPTLSDKFVTEPSDVQDYFQHFCEKSPTGTITEDAAKFLSDDVIQHSGLYTFTVGPADARIDVQARFTYIWVHLNNKWLISHHHSSLVPDVQ